MKGKEKKREKSSSVRRRIKILKKREKDRSKMKNGTMVERTIKVKERNNR